MKGLPNGHFYLSVKVGGEQGLTRKQPFRPGEFNAD